MNSFIGLLFIILSVLYSIKGLQEFDADKPKLARHRLQQIFQMGIALFIIILSTGMISSIALGFQAPESFNSLMLDSETAYFRYSMILYFFGASIFLRQLFPYFRYVLMGLLSLSSAYIVFDAVNYFV